MAQLRNVKNIARHKVTRLIMPTSFQEKKPCCVTHRYTFPKTFSDISRQKEISNKCVENRLTGNNIQLILFSNWLSIYLFNSVIGTDKIHAIINSSTGNTGESGWRMKLITMLDTEPSRTGCKILFKIGLKLVFDFFWNADTIVYFIDGVVIKFTLA